MVSSLILTGLVAASLGAATARALGQGWAAALEALLFDAAVAAILYGSTVYLVARMGWLRRVRRHRPASRTELDAAVFDGDAKPLVVLVPSYREDPAVVRQTLMSAALQDYPNRRVVLLLDDPPDSSDPDTEAARRLPEDIEALLRPMARRLSHAATSFQARMSTGSFDPEQERLRLAELYDDAARWFADRASGESRADHISDHFVAITFDARVEEMRQISSELRLAVGSPFDPEATARLHRRLAAVFDVSLAVLERKRFDNLSHEPNKAMNLNAYLGLMGSEYAVVGDGPTRQLIAVPERGDLVVPDATWVVTLDADSTLVHDYASRLVERLGHPGMERVAVIQTPYSAVPGASARVERTAGATTDIMHVVHQGMTAFDATYWVGANALIRRSALDDVMTWTEERGHRVPRFVQDRTVIEDTESSIDLVERGWRLFNYPERLAFSATPADYGSLLVQRRRWANGGLIILPKLLRHLRSSESTSLLSGLLRIHYLVSIASVNLALLVLMCVPFGQNLAGPLLPLTCLPYFCLYARDLRIAGYRARDVGSVYALNLLLTPVNMGGVLKSLQQAVTRRRIPFGRTPKVSHRTPAPAVYIVATLGLMVLWGIGCVFDVLAGRWAHAALVAVNLAIMGYAVTAFIGWRNCVEDVVLGARERLGSAAPSRAVATSLPRVALVPTPRSTGKHARRQHTVVIRIQRSEASPVRYPHRRDFIRI